LLLNRFGNDFKVVLRKDFGLSDFDGFTERIFLDFKTSIRYWLTNREYDILQSNYGTPSVIRFEDCEAYEFTSLLADMQSILRKCIEKHTPTLKRRDISIKTLPKEFEITQLQKELKDLVGNISINEAKVRNVYNPENVDLKVTGVTNTPVRVIPVRVIPIESPEVAPPNVVEILDPPPIEPSVDSNIPQRGRDTVGRNIIRDVTAGDNELGTGFRPWIVNREIDRENIQ
jgi:hypothetical protein